MSFEQSFDFITSEITSSQNEQAFNHRVAQRALTVVRKKGALVGVKHGLYGGRDGLIGSPRPGSLLLQATEPYRVREENYLSLRNRPDSTKIPETELVVLDDEAARRFVIAEKIGERVLARFTPDSVEIPGIKSVTREHIEAIDALVGELDVSLQRVNTGVVGQLPRVDYMERTGAYGDAVYNVRELGPILAK